YDDEQALNQLGENSDVVTYEFENISSEQLKKLTKLYHIPQGYQAIELLQDRLTEKQTLLEANTQIVPFVQIQTNQDLLKAIEKLGFPFI
ncbi:5-(carboxyamino)imidazole ribonucleotide synthase, partial [Bacillus thuringiensis]|nr:5-(carboxyamino)imidazole ribonucleotide synthase [Bacillus thuringiensis]